MEIHLLAVKLIIQSFSLSEYHVMDSSARSELLKRLARKTNPQFKVALWATLFLTVTAEATSVNSKIITIRLDHSYKIRYSSLIGSDYKRFAFEGPPSQHMGRTPKWNWKRRI